MVPPRQREKGPAAVLPGLAVGKDATTVDVKGDEMHRINCWEYMRCGRNPGGAMVADLGLCPASTESRLMGINHGENGGRACWALTGTLCGNKIQGTFASKLGNCRQCEFFQRVRREEANQCAGTKAILRQLAKPAADGTIP